ncbi:MAG: hypothetical protein KA004_04915 [Verrucomicrobiales bacterium]|nr:hypothetical protein [Verrucomicrobiales bacterium]
MSATNPSPTGNGLPRQLRVHFLGVCGKAMAPIAAALARAGWVVTGSDENCYAPMLDYLREAGMAPRAPYAPGNVPCDAELVVVGKRVAECNPELQHVLSAGLPHTSFPRFLQQHFLRRSRNAVVAGGVGKTTTTSMLAWILEESGMAPDFLIGGRTRNLGESARFHGSAFAVIEGDEYASCFDDPRPKFLHYRPEIGIITNIVEDHPDLYDGMAALCAVFRQFVELLPAHGCLIYPHGDPAAAALPQHCAAESLAVGFESDAAVRIERFEGDEKGSAFMLRGQRFELPMFGRMNVMNAAMAVLAAERLGVTLSCSAVALAKFAGVWNRQDETAMGDVTLVNDKASHPRSLEELSSALRQKYPGRRLVSVIQPRATGGRDWLYQRNLPDALAAFDRVILTRAQEHNPQRPTRWKDAPFCIETLGEDLAARNVDVCHAWDNADVVRALDDQIKSGDVILLTLLEQSHELRRVVTVALQRRARLSAGEPDAQPAQQCAR